MKFAVVAAFFYVFAIAIEASTVLYRYKDDNGGVVMGVTVPPEFAKNGYEVLNSNGRVIQTIDPALTPEQIEQKRKLEKLEADRQAQLIENKTLLKRYSHPDDAVRAEMRKLQDLQSVIRLKQGNALVQKTKLEDAETAAADRERAGQSIPDHLLKEVNRANQEILNLNSEIAGHLAEMEAVKKEYNAIVERLIKITGKQPTLIIPPEVLTVDGFTKPTK
jgi:chromosome segregation ATPase